MKYRTRLSLFLAGAGLVACESEAPRYGVVDTPTPVPAEVEGPEHSPDEGPAEPDPALVADCVRGTGRNAGGECEALRRFDAGYVQRIQMPRGAFVMGDIPTRYDASKTRVEPATKWSGNPPRPAQSGAFWIDLHEVTRAAYAACVESGKCTPARCPEGAADPTEKYADDELGEVPQTCVTHEQAERFCASHSGRLPTEAEWEYAARGVDARLFPWGNDVRDEYRQALLPVSGPVDLSYFGLRGMGTNALEWVAESFDVDAGLRPFIESSFRSGGPLGPVIAELSKGHVVKGGRAGAREGLVASNVQVGFRCAADLDANETPLDVPEDATDVPLVVDAGALQVFGGVAEVVNRREAETFCEVLRVPWKGSTLDDWRLPSVSEVQAISGVFRGPGPFWTARAAAEQQGDGPRAAPDDPWVPIEAKPAEGLAARCVRGS